MKSKCENCAFWTWETKKGKKGGRCTYNNGGCFYD